MWPVVHGQVIVGLILAQVVLTFVFAIKKLVWAAIITAITIVTSIIFHLAVKKRFFPPQLQMSYRGATDGDFADGVRAPLKPVLNIIRIFLRMRLIVIIGCEQDCEQ